MSHQGNGNPKADRLLRCELPEQDVFRLGSPLDPQLQVGECADERLEDELLLRDGLPVEVSAERVDHLLEAAETFPDQKGDDSVGIIRSIAGMDLFASAPGGQAQVVHCLSKLRKRSQIRTTGILQFSIELVQLSGETLQLVGKHKALMQLRCS